MFRVIIPQLQMSVANVYFSWQSRAHPRLSRRKKRKLCLRYPRPPKWVPFPQQLWKKKLPGCGQLGSGRKSHYRRCWSSPKKANLGEPARSVISPHLPTVEASPAMIFLPASSSSCCMKTAERKQNSPPTRGNSQLTGHGTSRSLHIGGSGLCSGVAT